MELQELVLKKWQEKDPLLQDFKGFGEAYDNLLERIESVEERDKSQLRKLFKEMGTEEGFIAQDAIRFLDASHVMLAAMEPSAELYAVIKEWEIERENQGKSWQFGEDERYAKIIERLPPITARFKLDGKIFRKFIELAVATGQNNIKFTAKNSKVRLWWKDVGVTAWIFKTDEPVKETRCMFDPGLLKLACNFSPEEICLRTDAPIEIHGHYNEVRNIVFYIAPRRDEK